MARIKVERSTPKPGSRYLRKWKDVTYEMTVVNEGATLHYKVDDKLFTSPSGAAKYITKQEVNGWRFWKLKD